MATHQNVKPKGIKDANKPEFDHKIACWLDGRTIHSNIQSMSEKVSVWVGQSPCAEVENPKGLFHAWPVFGKLPTALQTNLLKAIILWRQP
jgi:hypothetical protein